MSNIFSSQSVATRIGGPVIAANRRNNYARSDMLLGVSSTITSDDADGQHGKDITADEYNSEEWWRNAENWYTEDGAFAWDFVNIWYWDEDAQLPKLRNVPGQ
jgi:hypothetical protein